MYARPLLNPPRRRALLARVVTRLYLVNVARTRTHRTTRKRRPNARQLVCGGCGNTIFTMDGTETVAGQWQANSGRVAVRAITPAEVRAEPQSLGPKLRASSGTEDQRESSRAAVAGWSSAWPSFGSALGALTAVGESLHKVGEGLAALRLGDGLSSLPSSYAFSCDCGFSRVVPADQVIDYLGSEQRRIVL